MQGLRTSDAQRRADTNIDTDIDTDIDTSSITGQFKAFDALGSGTVNEAIDLPDDRRNRVERRRMRNPVFEARARRVGMALDRRRRRGWLESLRGRSRAALRSLRSLGADSGAQPTRRSGS